MVAGGASDTERLAEDVQKLFRHKEDGTAECDALKKHCETVPQWTKKAISRIGSQVLKKREARSIFRKGTIWRSTDFLIHAVGETEGRGSITFTCVCEHCKLFPVEDLPWWVSLIVEKGERDTV